MRPRKVRRKANDNTKASNQFQSTHPCKVRLYSRMGIPNIWQFQSTHPRKVRPCLFGLLYFSTQFQPTHPRKVRPNFRYANILSISVSTHAPGTAPFVVLYLHTAQLKRLCHGNKVFHRDCSDSFCSESPFSSFSVELLHTVPAPPGERIIMCTAH